MYKVFLLVCFILLQAAQYSYGQHHPAVSIAAASGQVGGSQGTALGVGIGSKSSTADAKTVVTPHKVVSKASATATSGKKGYHHHPHPHYHKKPGCSHKFWFWC